MGRCGPKRHRAGPKAGTAQGRREPEESSVLESQKQTSGYVSWFMMDRPPALLVPSPSSEMSSLPQPKAWQGRLTH